MKNSPMIYRLPSAEKMFIRPEIRGHSPGAPNMNLLDERLLGRLVLGNAYSGLWHYVPSLQFTTNHKQISKSVQVTGL